MNGGAARRRGMTEKAWVRWGLTGIAVLYLGVFLFVPLAAVFAQALEKGVGVYLESFREADALSAIRLTLVTLAVKSLAEWKFRAELAGRKMEQGGRS